MFVKKIYTLFLTAFAFFQANQVFAAAAVDDVSRNIVASGEELPGILSAFSYLLGLIIGITAILKIKEHVDSPQQTPLRTGLIRLIVAGALFALPIVTEAAFTSFEKTGVSKFEPTQSFAANFFGGAVGLAPDAGGINQLMENIFNSVDETPGIVTAISYLLGLLFCVAGILKIKEHVENPDQTPVKDAVGRLLIGGAMFALPTIFTAAYITIIGNPGNATGVVGGVMGGLYAFQSAFAFGIPDHCGALPSGTGGLGYVACQLVNFSTGVPSFLEAVSYIFGIVLAVWGLIKIRDYVLNIGQTSIWEGVARLLAAGAFFAMPYVSEVMRSSVSDGMVIGSVTGYGGGLTCGGGGGGTYSLDVVVGCFMQDMMAPLHVLFNFFAWIAGLVFIMIGISRLMKSSQEGARAPGGIGTLTTFFIGGILISYNAIVGAVSSSFFGDAVTETTAALSYTKGMTAAEVAHVHIVSEAIIQFMIVVGLISFIRGWFIMRDVAEGNQQASLMAGTTHILAGALAVNLGPLLNAVQATLNVGAVGMKFT